MVANSYFYEMTQIYIGGKDENDRVASPESVPIQLQCVVIPAIMFYRNIGFCFNYRNN